MADLEKIVQIVFEGKDELSNSLKMMDKNFSDFTGKVQSVTGPLGDFGVSVAKAEAALVTMAAAGMAVAIQKAGEFETAVSKITAVTSDEELAGFGNLNQALLDMGNTSAKPITDLAAALADAKGAGYDLSEAFDIVSGAAERLAVVGNTSLQTAFNVIDSSLKNFQSSAGDADEAASTIFKTFDLGKISIEEIEEPFASAAGVVAAAGLSFDEFNAAIAYLTSTGMAPANAIDAIKSACVNILKPSEQAKDMAEKLGINFSIAGVNANGFSGFLEILQRTASKEDLAVLVGDVQGLNAMLKLTSEEGLPAFNSMLGEMQDAADPLAEKYEEMKNSLDNVWQTTVNNIDSALIKSAIPMLESFKGVVSGFGDVFVSLQDAVDDDTFKPITDAINGFFNDTTELLKTVATNLPAALEGVDFSGLIDAFKDLGAEVGDVLDAMFGGELDLTTAQGLEDAVQKVVDIAETMTAFTEGFVSGLEPLATLIGEITSGITEMDNKTVEAAGKASGVAELIDRVTGSLQLFEKAIYTIATGSIISAGAALGVFLIPVAGITLGITAAGTAVGLFLLALDKLGLVDMGDLWQDMKDGFSQITDMFSDEENQPKIEPGLADGWVSIVGSDIKSGLETIGDEMTLPPIEIVLDDAALQDLKSDEIFVDGKKVSIWAEFDDMSYDKVQSQVEKFPPVAGQYSLDGTNWIDVEGDINANVPKEKEVEVKLTVLEQAKIDLERDLTIIETNAANIQTAMEWNAKVNIAEAEAAAKTITAAFESAGGVVNNLTDAVSSMFSDLIGNMGDLGQSDKWFAMDALEREMDMQQEALTVYNELVKQQTEYMRLKNEAIASGETAEIKIDSTGLEPALELVMWHIIEKVQIRANENAQEFLLGLPPI